MNIKELEKTLDLIISSKTDLEKASLVFNRAIDDLRDNQVDLAAIEITDINLQSKVNKVEQILYESQESYENMVKEILVENKI